MSGAGSGTRRRWAGLAVVVVALVALGVWLTSDGDEPSSGGGGVVRAPVGRADPVVTPASAPGASGPEAITPVDAASTLAPGAADAQSPEQVLAAALASAEHVLTGRIVRPDGTPVPGVALAVGVTAGDLFETCSRAGWLEHRVRPGDVPLTLPLSDAQGAFRLPVPSRSRTLLMAADLAPCDRQVLRIEDVEPGVHDAGDLILEYGAAFSGRIVGPEGQPLRDVQVLAHTDGRRPEHSKEQSSAMWSLRHARSRADGTFLLKGLLDARGDVELSTHGWESLALPGLETVPGEVVDLGDLVLFRGGVLGGVVEGPDGRPRRRLRVHAQLEDRLGLESGSAAHHEGRTRASEVTDEQGRFLITGLREGVYSVHVGGPGTAMTRLSGFRTGRTDLVLPLGPGGRALIEVRSAVTGQPLPDATVDPRRPESARYLPWIDGSLRVAHGPEAGQPIGTHVLEHADPLGAAVTVEAPGHRPHSFQVPGLSDGQVHAVTVTLERSLVFAGLALDHQDRPIANVAVTLSPADEATRALPPASGLSGADGAFHLQGLGPGRWQVQAEHDRYVRAGPAERLLVDADVGGFLVRLYPAGHLTGKVLLPAGGPGADAEITALLLARYAWPALAGAARDDALVSQPGTGEASRTVTADVEGRFSMPTLDPGRYLVTASREKADVALERLRSLAPVQDPDLGIRAVGGPLPGEVGLLSVPSGEVTEVELVLPVPGRILGQVTVEGHAAADAEVVVLNPAGDGWTAVAATRTDRGGQFGFAELWPGRFAVVAGVVGEPLPRARVLDLAMGETARVDFGFDGVSQTVLLRDVATGQGAPGVALRIIRRTEGVTTPECVFDLGWSEFWELTRRGDAFAAPVTTDAEGRARFPHLLPGKYYVSLDSDDWWPVAGAQHTVGDTWSPELLVVDVEHQGVLEITAVDRRSGRVLIGFTLRLDRVSRPGGGTPAPDSRRIHDEVERFPHLSAGDYVVTLESEQGVRLATRTITLAPGESLRIDFRVDA